MLRLYVHDPGEGAGPQRERDEREQDSDDQAQDRDTRARAAWRGVGPHDDQGDRDDDSRHEPAEGSGLDALEEFLRRLLSGQGALSGTEPEDRRVKVIASPGIHFTIVAGTFVSASFVRTSPCTVAVSAPIP